MTHELKVLAFSGLLQGLQFVLMSIPTNRELGPEKTSGPRDPAQIGGPLIDQVSPKTGRLIRAMNNHFEALILFSLAVVVISLGDKNTGFTAVCAWTYLGARILYVPAYYFGLSPWRSLVWFIGFAATMLMLLSTLI